MNRIILLLTAGVLFISSCTEKESTNEGAELAKTYCVSCHSYPEPDLLDKQSWDKYMLPRMGMFLGIYAHDSLQESIGATPEERALVKATGQFPEKAIISNEEWEKLKAFYIQHAPEQMEQPAAKSISKGLASFEEVIPEYKLSPPSATMVHIDTINNALFLGDANSQSLSIFSSDLEYIQGAKVGETPVWMEEFPNEYFITIMGSFSPTDMGSGYILSLPKGNNQPYKLIDSLKRPVHSSYGDLNGDGLMDIVTCEFSKWTGVLAWWKNNGDGSFEKIILRNRPGAVKAYIKDMNQDGKDDIIALFGQGDEGIYTYYNDGQGKFREKTTLRFPPSYGSTYFQLYDYNQDGHDDIIYAAGDNADFPPILKHYHGIYIYLNDGSNHYKQEKFLQLNGAYAAMPDDYDMDGDIDIAAISFFPDYKNQPDESFIFYTNDGNGNFSMSTIKKPTMGRWIVMDAADIDNDGDKDIVLGSLAFEVIPPMGLVEKWVQNGNAYLLLKNTTK